MLVIAREVTARAEVNQLVLVIVESDAYLNSSGSCWTTPGKNDGLSEYEYWLLNDQQVMNIEKAMVNMHNNMRTLSLKDMN